MLAYYENSICGLLASYILQSNKYSNFYNHYDDKTISDIKRNDKYVLKKTNCKIEKEGVYAKNSGMFKSKMT